MPAGSGWTPRRLGLVVAHQHRVVGVALLGDLADFRHRGPDPGAAEELVHLLRGVRQERRQQGVAVADRLQRVASTVRMRSSSVSLSFQGAWSETYLLASPTTRIASAMAAFCRGAPAASRPSRTPRGSSRQLVVGLGEAVSSGMEPTFLAAIEIERLTRAPAGDQLVVVAAPEFRPGEVGVLRLRPGGAMK